MKQDDMKSLKDVTAHSDPSTDIEISPAHSATSHTDVRPISSYKEFSERVREDFLKNIRIAKTISHATGHGNYDA
jgi:hypothetical protein